MTAVLAPGEVDGWSCPHSNPEEERKSTGAGSRLSEGGAWVPAQSGRPAPWTLLPGRCEQEELTIRQMGEP